MKGLLYSIGPYEERRPPHRPNIQTSSKYNSLLLTFVDQDHMKRSDNALQAESVNSHTGNIKNINAV